jgi:hypothetical protein
MNPAQFGRYGDNTMVHMNNEEVAGLASLAKSMGRELTTNPVTGYPEAFSLKDALPTIVGLGAGMATANPYLIGAAVGGTTAATTGSLEQGLLAGVTAGAMTGVSGELAAQGAGGAPIPEMTTSQAVFDQAGKQIGSQVVPDVAKNQAVSAAQQNAARLAGQGMDQATLGRVMESQYGGPLGQDITGRIASRASAQAMPFGTTKAGQMFQGAKNLLSDPSGKALGSFAKSQALPLSTAGLAKAGQMQQASIEASGDAREQAEAEMQRRGEQRRAEIEQFYADAGRPLPVNRFTGLPYADGGIVGLMGGGRPADAAPSAPPQMTPEQMAFLQALMGGSKDVEDLQAKANVAGGKAAGGYLNGGSVGDGMSDDIPATIDGTQPAALSTNEFVVPADVVSGLGNGSSDAGAQQLYAMMDRIRKARTGTTEQAPEINAKKYMPA